MLEGLTTVLGPEFILYLILGVMGGIAVGALPGFTATMGTALLLPFTFTLSPGVSLGMLGGLYVAAMYSDCIPAILVNTPGTPASMATAFDGYPMTQKGEGQHALVAGGFASMVGAILGGFAFLLVAPPLSLFALRFGPPEFFWIAVFAITIIGSIAGDSLLKGLAGGAIGMLISTIGLSSVGAVSRFTFGISEFIGGVSLVAALIGIFALPQVLSLVSSIRTQSNIAELSDERGVTMDAVRRIMRRPGNLLRSAIIGIIVGIIPGAGSPVAALLSYNESRRFAKDRKDYGKGSIHGVVASEAANSSAAGGALVPLVALGVPGSPPAAIILGALLLQGIQPGPTMMRESPLLIYGFGWSVVLAGVITFILGSILARPLTRMAAVPIRILVPVILTLSLLGSHAIRNNIFDLYAMVGLGIIVYFLNRLGFHAGPIGLGLILGPIVEPALIQSISISAASDITTVFFRRPFSVVLISLSIISLLLAGITNYQAAKERRALGVLDKDPEAGGPVIRETALIAIVLGAIAATFYFRTGRFVGTADRPLDWMLPNLLIRVIALAAVLMMVRALIGRGGRKIPLVPPILLGRGKDVAFVTVTLAIGVALIARVGFWLTVLIMTLTVSRYLTFDRDRKTLLVGLGTIAVVILGMQYVMWNVFYVPVPKTFFLR